MSLAQIAGGFSDLEKPEVSPRGKAMDDSNIAKVIKSITDMFSYHQLVVSMKDVSTDLEAVFELRVEVVAEVALYKKLAFGN